MYVGWKNLRTKAQQTKPLPLIRARGKQNRSQQQCACWGLCRNLTCLSTHSKITKKNLPLLPAREFLSQVHSAGLNVGTHRHIHNSTNTPKLCIRFSGTRSCAQPMCPDFERTTALGGRTPQVPPGLLTCEMNAAMQSNPRSTDPALLLLLLHCT